MRIEAGLPHLNHQVVPTAVRAEELGFDGVVAVETAHEPFLPLVLAAEHTKKVSLRTGLAIAFPRSPMIVANVGWDLQGYSDGRFILGLGPQVKGHNERRFSVPWSPPAPRLREYVLALKAIWRTWATGEKLNFQGEHYNFTLMTFNFTPEKIANPNIPVYISALGPAMARVAGEVADGIMLHPMASYQYVTDVILPALEEGAKRAGRSLDDIEVQGAGFSATGDTPEELSKSIRQVARQISFYGSTRTYQAPLALHGWKDLNLELHELSLAGKWDEMHNRVTDEMVATIGTVGTQEEVARQTRERFKGIRFATSLSLPAVGDTKGEERTKNLMKILRGEVE